MAVAAGGAEGGVGGLLVHAGGGALPSPMVGGCRLTLSNPKLKPPRTKRLKLRCDMRLSNVAFEFNWRRYTMMAVAGIQAGVYTRPRLSST